MQWTDSLGGHGASLQIRKNFFATHWYVLRGQVSSNYREAITLRYIGGEFGLHGKVPTSCRQIQQHIGNKNERRHRTRPFGE